MTGESVPPHLRRLASIIRSRARTWWRQLLIHGVFALALARPAIAAADSPGPRPGSADVEKSPHDVPMVVEPSGLVIPPIPDTDQVRDLGWMRIAYPPSAHERVQPLLDEADDVKARLADELGQPVLSRPIEVRVARTPEEMASLAPKDVVPEYASAVAMPGLRLIILSMRAPVSDDGTDLGELLRHELAHVALDDAIGSKHVPFWFNEGYAVHASNERAMDRAETLSNASLWKTILPLSDLDRTSPTDRYEVSVAYAQSADFVRFLLRQSDRGRFASLIDRTRKGEPFDNALGDAYASNLRKLEYEWREELAKRYTFWPVLLSGSAIWVLVIAALGVGFVRKKKRDKLVLARWEQEEREEAEEAARRVAIRAALQTDPPPPNEGMRPVGPSVPKVEHDGDWHTLH